MPARKYLTEQERPVFLSTRMPRVVIDYLHLIVRLQPAGYVFPTLQHLHAEIAERFLADDPTASGFVRRTPRIAERSHDPLSFRQINFQVDRVLAGRIDRACAHSGVARASWLYTATIYYVRTIAHPRAIGLDQ